MACVPCVDHCCRTLVIWVADNGPTTSELQNGGTTGPFIGRWAAEVIDPTCYVCPADYKHDPTPAEPRRCTTAFPIPGSDGEKFFSLDGIPCAADVGLGSTWEANLRMPAFARWPGRIAPGTISMELVSTLDIFSTGLSLANVPLPTDRVIVRRLYSSIYPAGLCSLSIEPADAQASLHLMYTRLPPVGHLPVSFCVLHDCVALNIHCGPCLGVFYGRIGCAP